MYLITCTILVPLHIDRVLQSFHDTVGYASMPKDVHSFVRENIDHLKHFNIPTFENA